MKANGRFDYDRSVSEPSQRPPRPQSGTDGVPTPSGAQAASAQSLEERRKAASTILSPATTMPQVGSILGLVSESFSPAVLPSAVLAQASFAQRERQMSAIAIAATGLKDQGERIAGIAAASSAHALSAFAKASGAASAPVDIPGLASSLAIFSSGYADQFRALSSASAMTTVMSDLAKQIDALSATPDWVPGLKNLLKWMPSTSEPRDHHVEASDSIGISEAVTVEVSADPSGVASTGFQWHLRFDDLDQTEIAAHVVRFLRENALFTLVTGGTMTAVVFDQLLLMLLVIAVLSSYLGASGRDV